MFKRLTEPRRVVITGFGCVTPIGIGKDGYWSGLESGRSGVRRIESFDVGESTIKIAAEIPEFDWKHSLIRKIVSTCRALCRSRWLLPAKP
jgi:3-oxoacyl-[acyl-carrier-protein] synthase II